MHVYTVSINKGCKKRVTEETSRYRQDGGGGCNNFLNRDSEETAADDVTGEV